MIEKLRAAYLRMNRREQIMTLAISAFLFLVINLFVWRLVVGSISSSRREPLRDLQFSAHHCIVVVVDRQVHTFKDKKSVWLLNIVKKMD